MYGGMTGASAWMMTPSWDGTHLALLFAMWTAMMTGMMLPSAAPTLLVYGMVARRDDARGAPLRVHLFARRLPGGVDRVQRRGDAGAAGASPRPDVLSPMMEVRSAARGRRPAGRRPGSISSRRSSAPACSACQSPAAFLVKHWRAGAPARSGIGLVHGWYCLGCCWALMLLLFAGGVMNLTVIVGLTVFLLVEKLMPPPCRAAGSAALSSSPPACTWPRVLDQALVRRG